MTEQVNTDRLSSGRVLPYSRSLQPGCVLMTSHRSGQKSSGRGALSPQLVLQPELRVQEREDTASSCPYGFFRISLPNYSLKTVTWKVNLPFQGDCLLPPLPYTWQLPAQECTEQSNKTLPSRLPYRGWKSKRTGRLWRQQAHLPSLALQPHPCSGGGWEEPIKVASRDAGPSGRQMRWVWRRVFKSLPHALPGAGQTGLGPSLPAACLQGSPSYWISILPSSSPLPQFVLWVLFFSFGYICKMIFLGSPLSHWCATENRKWKL